MNTSSKSRVLDKTPAQLEVIPLTDRPRMTRRDWTNIVAQGGCAWCGQSDFRIQDGFHICNVCHPPYEAYSE